MQTVFFRRFAPLAILGILSVGLTIGRMSLANIRTDTSDHSLSPASQAKNALGQPAGYGARIDNPIDKSRLPASSGISVTSKYGCNISGDYGDAITVYGTSSIDGNQVASKVDSWTYNSSYTVDYYEDKVIGGLSPLPVGTHYVTASLDYTFNGGPAHNIAQDDVTVTLY